MRPVRISRARYWLMRPVHRHILAGAASTLVRPVHRHILGGAGSTSLRPVHRYILAGAASTSPKTPSSRPRTRPRRYHFPTVTYLRQPVAEEVDADIDGSLRHDRVFQKSDFVAVPVVPRQANKRFCRQQPPSRARQDHRGCFATVKKRK